MDAREHQADLERQRDLGPAGGLVQPGRPGEPEGLRLQQDRVHSNRRGAGQPGLPADTRPVPEPDQEAEGQFPAVPGGEEVGGAIKGRSGCASL